MLPTEATPTIPQEFPLLLRNFDKLCVKSASYTPTDSGFSPINRPISEYLKYGVINLDKPSGPSSHEVVSWVKRMIPGCDRTGHSGTLDPKVTGALLVCLNRATRLVKSQQEMGKQYVCILQFEGFKEVIGKVGGTEFVRRCKEALKSLTAPQLQRPPAEGCAVKRVLRLREIYDVKLLECCLQTGRLLFTVDCEAGTYVRTLCCHVGMLVGCEAAMLELRRTRSGFLTQQTNMVTLHQVLDAIWLFKNRNDESYLRKVVMPMEFLLIKDKIIIVKDSAVAAICHGAQVLIQGVVRYSHDINIRDRVVIATTKGEAVALAIAAMSSPDIAGLNHGVVAKPTRVLMDRELYVKQWGKGPVAKMRKELIQAKQLGKKGQIIDGVTPQTYIERHCDVQAFLAQAGNTCRNSMDTNKQNIQNHQKSQQVQEPKIIGQENDENEQKHHRKHRKKHRHEEQQNIQ